MMPGKGFSKCVERAGADIAEYHPDRADRKFPHALRAAMLVQMRALCGRRGVRGLIVRRHRRAFATWRKIEDLAMRPTACLLR